MFKNINKCRGLIIVGITMIAGFLFQGNVSALDYQDYFKKGEMLYEQGEYDKAQVEFEKARDALKQPGSFIRTEKQSEKAAQELKGLHDEKIEISQRR